MFISRFDWQESPSAAEIAQWKTCCDIMLALVNNRYNTQALYRMPSVLKIFKKLLVALLSWSQLQDNRQMVNRLSTQLERYYIVLRVFSLVIWKSIFQIIAKSS